MKDNSLDGHRGKVALSDTTRNATSTTPIIKCELKTSPPSTAPTTANDGSTATNFDDDYNEWELGIGDLIIDLDADIEKTNERNGVTTQQGIQHHQNGTTALSPSSAVNDSSPTSAAATFSFLGSPCNSGNLAAAMSNSKSPRLSNSGVCAGTASTLGTGVTTTSGTNSGAAGGPGTGAFEHQATVDKGLKMKIKRKTVGSKYSEAKHEIVQSDTKSLSVTTHALSDNSSVTIASNNCASVVSTNSPVSNSEAPKSKHSSSKGRNSSHREKKDKNRDKDKNSSARNSTTSSTPMSTEVNGVLGVMSPLKITSSGVSLASPAPPPLCSNSSPLPCSNNVSNTPSTTPVPPVVTNVADSPTNSNCSPESVPANTCGTILNLPLHPVVGSNSPPMPNLTLKLETKFTSSPISQMCPSASPVVIKQEEEPSSPPQKKIKMDIPEQNGELDCPSSPSTPEMRDASTCISVGTITEPECLGPCEPGTSVTLEGIVWQETDGGVLVVNVTWRDKSYVGTLLDCTKHDWAPPRFCESPTSDVDSKTAKGRGKRGRGGNNSSTEINFADARNCVQSKLRNGKGRRTTVNSNSTSAPFTVPNSPAKSDSSSSNGKRKGRPADLEITTPPAADNKSSKRSRNNQNRSTPTSSSTELSQPSSPVLIVCPEPNCSKKYKHINGLRYHQTHAHSTSDSSSKMDDTATEDSKDVTNSSDNEESMQESASVSTSPAPTFENTAPTNEEKLLLNETVPSSPSLNGLPESDSFTITTDLSTLASIAINDSKTDQTVTPTPPLPVVLHSSVSQDLPIINTDRENVPGLNISNSLPNSSSSSLLPVPSLLPVSPSASGTGLSTAVSAVTTSVIQSSNSVDNIPSNSQAVTVSIPTSHVIFNQGISGSNCTTPCFTSSSVICNNSNSMSPSMNIASANVTTTFAQVSSVVSTSVSPSPMLPTVDKSKIKQERLDKYKPKSPLSTTSAIRPIVPVPTQLMTLSPNISPLPGMDVHGVASSLKPIQPKPTILGEPTTVNPSLESLKREKSKHKKKSKDKERDKKLPSLPLTPTKLGMNPNEECEAIELTSYPSLEAVSGSTGTLPGTPRAGLSSLVPHSKTSETSLDMNLADDSINENVQSPAYSDISDANDTAPVLESEVVSVKEKEDKVDKATPDAAQSPAANINAYGMYTPYYSQPPYLIPSVSPQSAVAGSQAPSLNEKTEVSKKVDQVERVKDSRPWSNPSVESRERPHPDHEAEKKVVREENMLQNTGPISSPAGGHGPLQEYSLPPQHYPYSYGYVQGYPYSLEPSYHMHMLENDPHYKQQYKQYIEEQQRLYKEQQHHQQQQQIQQQMQHHQQQQQQQQQQQLQPPPQHHSHQPHHSQHPSHHQSKSQHHASIKEERDRSRESKERSGHADKMTNSGLIVEHPSKIQHSSMAMVSNKDHDVREIDPRPPSLPAQNRIESSTPISASAAALKEKQNENHQILKENIELKSQMDESKNKMNQYEMAMLYERHKEDMRRYYAYDKIIEQQQQRMEPGIHHHTHHHQTLPSHGHIQTSSSGYLSGSSSIKPHKDELSNSLSSHSKSNHYGDSTRSSVVSPAKSEHVKSSHTNATSSPKGSIRESSHSSSKEYMSSVSSRESSVSKKDSQGKSSERSESSSSREEKKSEKPPKVEPKVESEGQKPTMETTGPPPPPTNSYAYLHPSYLQGPPHFPHMPFEPAHAMYRGGINPMIVSTPHYGSSPYVHPQIRYVAPGACEIPAHPQPPDALSGKLHPAGPPKALDLLHQVSQHYTTTHKIHELQEHALMSPTPTSTPSSTPSTVSSSASGKSSAEPVVVSSKLDATSRDASRSPPTQRHIHQHHHTHVGVGYPIYDPYGAIIQSPAPAVDCKPIHPLQVKPPAAGARFWP